jgi:hypothetical protein
MPSENVFVIAIGPVNQPPSAIQWQPVISPLPFSENVPAHYNLSLLYGLLGDSGKAPLHHQLHERYRVDDNARDRAVAAARLRDPAADHAAQTIVIYDLQRPGTLGMMIPPAPRPNTSGDTNSLAALLRRSP